MQQLALLVGLGLATCALAQAPAGLQPVPYPALENLAGGTWYAAWNPATQTPRQIWGTGIQIDDWRENTIDEARRHALAAIESYGSVIGTAVPGTLESTFREVIGARMGRTWTFTFDQFHEGLEVVGGRVDVRVNMSGVIAMIGSTAWQIPQGFVTTPKISEAAAKTTAWMALGEEPVVLGPQGVQRKPRLCIWGDVHAETKQSCRLAWEIPIDNLTADGQGTVGRYYVDAQLGHVLRFETDRHSCGALCVHPGASRVPVADLVAEAPAVEPVVETGMAPVPTVVTVMAWTRTGRAANSPLQNVPLRNLVVSVPGQGSFTTDSNGQFTVDLASAVTVTIGALDGLHCQPIGGSGWTAASQSVQPGVNTTIQLLTAAAAQDVACHTTTYWWVDEVNEWTRGILGTLPGQADSVSPNVNQNGTCNAFYSTGANTINFYPAGGGCNNTAFSTVITHEWGHGLDNWYGGISNNSGDGLSEAIGDIVSMYIVDHPVVGEFFTTSGGFVRTGNNTTTYPPPSPVHSAGEVYMGFAWQLRQNLRASNASTAIGISNDIVIGAVAADPTNQVDSVREVFIADDDDGNLLNGVPHYNELSAAANTKNLPYPEVQIGAITHAGLTNTQESDIPRAVRANVQAFSGSILSSTLHFQVAGQSPVVRTMYATGQPNEVLAMLPGLPFGSPITYHIEAAHSSGLTLRLPASGEFGYQVSVANVLFSEDFENGAPGWTHALVRQQDDWQLGDPAGKSGTGWTDPQTAANGTNCYSNDLGNTINGQLWNGAYQNNVTNWLRAPTFSTIGQSGLRLRFNRWLTIESGQWDQAEILVNGQVVWVNDQNQDTVDTAWSQMDIAIPQADNQASVQLEWRLTTDVSVVFGGWNIDDVEVYAPGAPPSRDSTLTLLPEQLPPNTAAQLAVSGQPNQVSVLVIGTTQGPLVIGGGLPDLLVGGTMANFLVLLDASGNGTASMQSGPAIGATVGLMIYAHGLTYDAAGAIIATNPTLAWFTP